MRGYKALDKDMKSIYGDDMQYETGKLYFTDGRIVLYKNGFHFCKNIEYLNCYYDIRDSRIFEIEAYGNVKSDGIKYAAESIQLIRELTGKEINEYFKTNQRSLIGNEYPDVRLAVAEQGYGLDILVYDECWMVRRAVAEQGYGLDVLINDKDWRVRMEVAGQGYGLDILIHDEIDLVRYIVAKQGYGPDVLIHDDNYNVRETAKTMLDSSTIQ